MLTKQNSFNLPVKWQFPDHKKYAFALISLLVMLFVIYSNSFYGDWHFDDFGNINKNPHIQIKSFSWEEIKTSFYGMEQKRPSRPLSYLSLALNYYFDGTNVFGYHVVNFIIHYLAAVFLFLFIYNTLKLPRIRDRYENIAYPLALLASLFWAINPVFVSSVTYIVQRMASMAAMFHVMAMYFYLRGRTAKTSSPSIIFLIISIFAGLAAVLSKENAAMLPVNILLFELFLIQGASKENIKRMLKIIILPLAIILVFGLIYTGGFSNAFGGYEIRDFTMSERVLTQPRVIIFYLSLLLYPISSRLTLLYDIDVSRSLFQPWTTLPAILLVVAAIGIALYLVQKRPLISYCMIFFFLNHFIEGSIFNLELIYEHRNYLPAMLLFVPVTEFFIYVIDYFAYKKLIQFSCALGIIIIIAGLGDITYRRNDIFSNDDKLWLDNIEKYPNLSRTYSNLGNTYIALDMKEKGLAAYNKSMAVNNFANIYARALQEHNFGLFYFQERQYEKALPYFERSMVVMPDYLSNVLHIAKIKLLNGKTAEAGHLIEAKLKKYPNNSELLELFSLILLKGGHIKQAERAAQRILELNINAVNPLMTRAEIARKNGNYQGAIRFWNLYKKAAPLSPYANLALIELYQQTNEKKLLEEELARLACFKGVKQLRQYLEEISQDKKMHAYVPDIKKILSIVKLSR